MGAAGWISWVQLQRRRRPIALLVVCCLAGAVFVVDDVQWQIRSASVGIWARYHEKFKSAPELGELGDNEKVILYWTPFFGTLEYKVGYGRRPFRNCPVSNCVTTNRRSYLKRAAAVVFHPVEFSDLDLPTWRSPRQLWVFFMLESPPNTGAKFTEATRGLFNLTVTYRRDSDIWRPYYVVERLPESERPPPEVSTTPPAPFWAMQTPWKARLPWVVSNCKTPGKREEYVQELRKYIPVDVYGRCGPLKCSALGGLLSPPDPRACYRHLPRHYQFYLSLENSRCRDYITEKFFLALNSSLVPVVYGARRSDYEAVAPPNSFVHTDDFAGPRELAAYIRYLMTHREAFERLTRWRREWRVRSTEADSWCELCRRLHAADGVGARPSNHADINRWWNAPDVCW